MFVTLIENFKLISILMAMFVGSFSANLLLGLYQNLAICKELFSKEKLLKGLAKGAIILISCLLIVAIISLLPEAIQAFGLTLEEGILDGISLAAFSGIIISAMIYYLKDAIQKFYNILYGSHLPKE